MPALQPFLACNGFAHVVKDFEIDEVVNSVLFGETTDEVVAVCVDAANEIVRHADIQRSITTAREYVHVVGHDRISVVVPAERSERRDPSFFSRLTSWGPARARKRSLGRDDSNKCLAYLFCSAPCRSAYLLCPPPLMPAGGATE